MRPVLGTVVFCGDDPSTVEALLNGLVAWAGVIGGGTGVGTGLPAAALAFASRVPPGYRADSINRGLGIGFLVGLVVGFFLFVAYASRLVT